MKIISGQVLIELLLALALSSVALAGMAEVATRALANSSVSKNRRSQGEQGPRERISRGVLGGWEVSRYGVGEACPPSRPGEQNRPPGS